jgi:hypothetical protein
MKELINQDGEKLTPIRMSKNEDGSYSVFIDDKCVIKGTEGHCLQALLRLKDGIVIHHEGVLKLIEIQADKLSSLFYHNEISAEEVHTKMQHLKKSREKLQSTSKEG